MKNIVLLLFVLCVSQSTHAQSDYTVPNYKFDTKDDYKKYAEDIVASVNYLEATPIQTDEEKGQKVAQFIMDWADGNPKVTVPINPQIVNFIQTAPFMLVYYVSGYCRYYIQQNGSIDDVDGVVAGLELVADVYTNHKLDKNESLAELAKLKDEHKLKEYVQEAINNFPKQ